MRVIPGLRTTTITAAIIAAVIAAAVIVPVVRLGGARAAGAAQPVAAASTSAGVVPAPPGAAPATTSAATPSVIADVPPVIATRSARLADVEADERAMPRRLTIGAIDIATAPIDPVGVNGDGTMEIPSDIRRIGWYDYGPSPGEDDGSAVLTAHIDSRTQGEGVFYHLDALAPGDAVEVEMSDGATRSFVVDEVRQVAKVDLPAGELFRRDGPHQLALITCGGTFDESSRRYRDNLVVIATPVP